MSQCHYVPTPPTVQSVWFVEFVDLRTTFPFECCTKPRLYLTCAPIFPRRWSYSMHLRWDRMAVSWPSLHLATRVSVIFPRVRPIYHIVPLPTLRIWGGYRPVPSDGVATPPTKMDVQSRESSIPGRFRRRLESGPAWQTSPDDYPANDHRPVELSTPSCSPFFHPCLSTFAWAVGGNGTKIPSVPIEKKGRDRSWLDYYDFLRNFADISYGYSITCHKSQGSTYNTTFVLEDDIDVNLNVVERNRIKYTAYTRSSKKVYILKRF